MSSIHNVHNVYFNRLGAHPPILLDKFKNRSYELLQYNKPPTQTKHKQA